MAPAEYDVAMLPALMCLLATSTMVESLLLLDCTARQGGAECLRLTPPQVRRLSFAEYQTTEPVGAARGTEPPAQPHRPPRRSEPLTRDSFPTALVNLTALRQMWLFDNSSREHLLTLASSG